MRNQSWNVSWKLRSHLGKHLLVISPPPLFFLIGGTCGEGVPVSTRVAAPGIGGPLGSPTLTTEFPTSLMKHTRPLPGELFLVLRAHHALPHFLSFPEMPLLSSFTWGPPPQAARLGRLKHCFLGQAFTDPRLVSQLVGLWRQLWEKTDREMDLGSSFYQMWS